jgi:hypothetical protein
MLLVASGALVTIAGGGLLFINSLVEGRSPDDTDTELVDVGGLLELFPQPAPVNAAIPSAATTRYFLVFIIGLSFFASLSLKEARLTWN